MDIYCPSVPPVPGSDGPSNVPLGRSGVLGFCQEVIQAARARGLLVSELGRVGEYPILHIHPKEPAVLLVAGGFHGDEVGGSLGILRWLQTRPEPPVPVSFLPLANPTGAALGTRENADGQDPNRGFVLGRESEVHTAEGVVLLNGDEYLMPQEAFLTLHEARDLDGYFQAAFEDAPSRFSTALLITGVKWFGLEKGLLEFEGKRTTFEDYLYHRGVHRAVCAEVPSKYTLDDRITCAAELIDTAIGALTM